MENILGRGSNNQNGNLRWFSPLGVDLPPPNPSGQDAATNRRLDELSNEIKLIHLGGVGGVHNESGDVINHRFHYR